MPNYDTDMLLKALNDNITPIDRIKSIPFANARLNPTQFNWGDLYANLAEPKQTVFSHNSSMPFGNPSLHWTDIVQSLAKGGKPQQGFFQGKPSPAPNAFQANDIIPLLSAQNDGMPESQLLNQQLLEKQARMQQLNDEIAKAARERFGVIPGGLDNLTGGSHKPGPTNLE